MSLSNSRLVAKSHEQFQEFIEVSKSQTAFNPITAIKEDEDDLQSSLRRSETEVDGGDTRFSGRFT